MLWIIHILTTSLRRIFVYCFPSFIAYMHVSALYLYLICIFRRSENTQFNDFIMKKEKIIVGWRENLSLPELGIDKIKAKIDTGARTSCLHAFKIEPFFKQDTLWVKFWIHPLQKNDDYVVVCEAKVIDQRTVRDSGGHEEKRYVIQSNVMLGSQTWPIEITLTNRENMVFRMLLGRTAMKNKIIVDPTQSFLIHFEENNS